MKRTICCILMLVMLLSMIPVFVLADQTLPMMTIEADKTVVKKGDTITLTMKLNKDVADKVAVWQWNFVWDSTYFTPVSATVGNVVQSGTVTPIVNYQNPTTQLAAPYACATVTSGNTVTPHNLKAGVIATLTLTAKRDVVTDSTVKFFLDDVIVANSEGVSMKVATSDPAVEWGDDKNKIPGASVGLSVAVKPLNEGATGVMLDIDELSMKVGETKTLVASVSDNLANKAMTWTSSDDSVATVTGGTVTAVAAGTATITVSVGDYQATCVVTVTEQVATTPTEPTEPSDPTEPSESTEPTESTGPSVVTDPTDPTAGECSDPTEPKQDDNRANNDNGIWIILAVVAVIGLAAAGFWILRTKKI